ncbi:FecCD family ABC transporter permease [Agrococcus casei]|uniref:Heme ABC transporter, permease protein HmuU n=1 Tax=Agrococcus casei LMG 22410 TaxID=1255656 RepID=A0A1R4GMG6_9MICO|nr:iron ABC transporter permease [Agrococcus casei]SJM69408.1 Heme ABC transporter, permease protein HmuU [Agrococcus casei LMG 22410]
MTKLALQAPSQAPRLLDLPTKPVQLPVSRRRAALLLTVIGVTLIIGVLLSVAIGQLPISIPEIFGSFCRKLGLGCTSPDALYIDGALWEVRLPRVVLTVLVGGALAAAGAVMQGIFGNPLADPGIIGVSSGAAVGASLAIVTGIGALSSIAIPGAAFVTALLTTFFVYAFSRSNGRTEVITLILTGIAVNAVAGAGLAFMTFAADTNQREQIVFWQMGSLAGSLWFQVGAVLPLVLIGVIAIIPLMRQLDLLALGDDAARHLGVDIEKLRVVAIVIVAVLTASAVSFAGIIGFVGLVVPHLIRMVAGPSHRLLIAASIPGGAAMLTLADLVARTAVPYAELPIGMITALIGGPFFFYLLRRQRSRTGGWA